MQVPWSAWEPGRGSSVYVFLFLGAIVLWWKPGYVTASPPATELFFPLTHALALSSALAEVTSATQS